MGSTRAARRAGIYAARTATIIINAAENAIVRGSFGSNAECPPRQPGDRRT
jgi:hypothetical protein